MKLSKTSPPFRKWIAEQPCAICKYFFKEFGEQPQCPQETVADHHLIPEDNSSRRSQDFNNLIPVGFNHHTGPNGVHTKFKGTERKLMEKLREVARLYTKRYLTKFKKCV